MERKEREGGGERRSHLESEEGEVEVLAHHLSSIHSQQHIADLRGSGGAGMHGDGAVKVTARGREGYRWVVGMIRKGYTMRRGREEERNRAMEKVEERGEGRERNKIDRRKEESVYLRFEKE